MRKNPSYTFIKSCCIRNPIVSCLLSMGNSNYLPGIVFLSRIRLLRKRYLWLDANMMIHIFTFLIGNPEGLQKNFEAIWFFTPHSSRNPKSKWLHTANDPALKIAFEALVKVCCFQNDVWMSSLEPKNEQKYLCPTSLK